MKLYIHDPITNDGGELIVDSLIETIDGADYTLQHKNIPSWLRVSFFYDDESNLMERIQGIHDTNAHLLTYSPHDTPLREVREDGLHVIRYIPQYDTGQRVVFLASMIGYGHDAIRSVYQRHRESILRGCEIYWELGDFGDLDDAIKKTIVDERLMEVAHCFVMGEMYSQI